MTITIDGVDVPEDGAAELIQSQAALIARLNAQVDELEQKLAVPDLEREVWENLRAEAKRLRFAEECSRTQIDALTKQLNEAKAKIKSLTGQLSRTGKVAENRVAARRDRNERIRALRTALEDLVALIESGSDGMGDAYGLDQTRQLCVAQDLLATFPKRRRRQR